MNYIEILQSELLQNQNPLYCTRRELCNTVDAAERALEKQMPKKPAYTCNNEIIHCPNCDYDLMGGD